MNNVTLIGRLTRDPDVRYTSSTQMAVARFSIAINRPTRKDGTEQTDFPNIVAFGKTAELCEKFLVKGRLVGIQGRIQTGSYEKNGQRIYTTDVVADRVEFLEWRDRQQKQPNKGESRQTTASASYEAPEENSSTDIPEGFNMIDDDDIPF